MSNDCAPTFNLSRVPKEFAAEMAMLRSFRCSRTHYNNRLPGSVPPRIRKTLEDIKRTSSFRASPPQADEARRISPRFFPTSAPRYTVPAVKILLLGTYELGRQPFALASPTPWL